MIMYLKIYTARAIYIKYLLHSKYRKLFGRNKIDK